MPALVWKGSNPTMLLASSGAVIPGAGHALESVCLRWPGQMDSVHLLPAATKGCSSTEQRSSCFFQGVTKSLDQGIGGPSCCEYTNSALFLSVLG